MSLITIINISGSFYKVKMVYFIMFTGYLFLALGFMYFYWKRSVEWRYKKHSHKQQFMDHDIALHSIMVSNINTKLSMDEAAAYVDLVFQKVFPDGRVICSKVIGRTDELF